MVLRIKEREEAIQLLAMDPQVYGKLLTLHRQGNRVDVDALCDRIPFRQDVKKGPKMGSRGNRGLPRRKTILVDASVGSGIFLNLQATYQSQRISQGPTSPQGAPQWRVWQAHGLLGHHLTPSPSSVDVFWSKKNHRKVLFRLDSV